MQTLRKETDKEVGKEFFDQAEAKPKARRRTMVTGGRPAA